MICLFRVIMVEHKGSNLVTVLKIKPDFLTVYVWDEKGEEFNVISPMRKQRNNAIKVQAIFKTITMAKKFIIYRNEKNKITYDQK